MLQIPECVYYQWKYTVVRSLVCDTIRTYFLSQLKLSRIKNTISVIVAYDVLLPRHDLRAVFRAFTVTAGIRCRLPIDITSFVMTNAMLSITIYGSPL